MRRARKIVLWSLAGLVLTASAAVAFLALAGDDFYRWALRQAIADTLDREVHADGSFSFQVGLEPTLIVTDVWLENAPWADTAEMARAERVEIQIDLRPLFSGIVRIPRLVLEGLVIDLETSADGEGNWQTAGANGGRAARPISPNLPLLEFISAKDIAVTHRDRQSGRDTEILLYYLHKEQPSVDASFELESEGRFNGRPFRLDGRFGSVTEALEATAPYPMELTLQASSLVAELTGTARNIATGEGFDISLDMRTPSIGEVLRAFEIDLPLVGLAEATARLRGDLESLVVEDIDVEIVERSGQELHALGRIANLVNGRDLDLQVFGKLDRQVLTRFGLLPPTWNDFLEGFGRIDLDGRMTGDLATPVVEYLRAQIEHDSGAEISLQGQALLDFSEDGAGLAGFETTGRMSLPDRTLLERALETPLPQLGAVRVSAGLNWAGDWITLHSAEVSAEALDRSRVSAEGRIGRLSDKDLAFELDPRIKLFTSINHSRPLVHLVETLATGDEPADDPATEPDQDPANGPDDNVVLLIQRGLQAAGLDPGPLDGLMGPATRAAIESYQASHGLAVDGRATVRLLQHLEEAAEATASRPSFTAMALQVSDLADTLPELGPVTATLQLSRAEGVYHFDDVSIAFGSKGTVEGSVTGKLGALRQEPDLGLEEIALTVNFTVPSSRMFAEFIPPEVPEFTNIEGRLALEGSLDVVSIVDPSVTAQGPDGLVVTASGKRAEFALKTGFTTDGLGLDLDARWPDTRGVLGFVELKLPDLGPVWARATLRDRGKTVALTGITIKAGSLEQPAALVTGEIGDLSTLRRIDLNGEFDISTATLLGEEAPPDDGVLGTVHGQFNLSDTDGSLGLEALSAEIEDTKLLSLSVEGLLDDIEHGDDLRVEAALSVPDLSQLGREFGFEAESFGSLSFTGEVSGSYEKFLAEGRARLGETDLTGTFSGTLKGERPVLQAKLHSPGFRFSDIGLVPPADTPEPEEPESAAAPSPSEGETNKRPAPAVFGETPIAFEVLKLFDLDLEVLFEDVKGIHLDMDKAEGHFELVDGVLRVEPLSFNFVGGHIGLTLLIDTRGDTPAMHLTLIADDVDLGDFLSQTKVEVPLDGELDLAVDLKAMGNTPRALADSLDGKLELAVERGQVLTRLLRLTTTNPVSWLFTSSTRRGYSEMNCLILRFDVQDGVAEGDTLLLDTPNIRALGEGRIDFGKEVIDIRVEPQAKRRRLISMSTPFHIEGPLADPSIRVSTTGTSLRTAGEVLLSPVNVLGSLLPFVSDRGKDKENPCLTLRKGTWHR